MNDMDHLGPVSEISLMNIPDQIIGIDRSTAANYQDAIRLYSRYVEDNHLEFSFDSVQSWLKTLSATTMNTRFYGLKKCLLEYYRNHPRLGELLKNLEAIRKVKVDKSVKQTDYLTREEVERLASGVPERLSLIIMALFWTGCRISELLSIRLKDCIIDEVVTITIIGKGKKQRDVYLSRQLYEAILSRFKGNTWLFEKSSGDPYNRVYITNRIREASKRILGKRISAHSLRHSKAMYLKDERKLTPDQIARSLGHSSVVTTLQHYFHGTPGPQEQGIL